jgi:rhamnogalacturonyl hydrolase YesR
LRFLEAHYYGSSRFRNVILNVRMNLSTKEFLFSVLSKPQHRWAWERGVELRRFAKVRSQVKQQEMEEQFISIWCQMATSSVPTKDVSSGIQFPIKTFLQESEMNEF